VGFFDFIVENPNFGKEPNLGKKYFFKIDRRFFPPMENPFAFYID